LQMRMGTYHHTLRRKIKVGKLYLPMAPLVGAPYGAMFMASADGKSLERMERCVRQLQCRVCRVQALVLCSSTRTLASPTPPLHAARPQPHPRLGLRVQRPGHREGQQIAARRERHQPEAGLRRDRCTQAGWQGVCVCVCVRARCVRWHTRASHGVSRICCARARGRSARWGLLAYTADCVLPCRALALASLTPCHV
jgi:hypothetical protein